MLSIKFAAIDHHRCLIFLSKNEVMVIVLTMAWIDDFLIVTRTDGAVLAVRSWSLMENCKLTKVCKGHLS